MVHYVTEKKNGYTKGNKIPLRMDPRRLKFNESAERSSCEDAKFLKGKICDFGEI